MNAFRGYRRLLVTPKVLRSTASRLNEVSRYYIFDILLHFASRGCTNHTGSLKVKPSNSKAISGFIVVHTKNESQKWRLNYNLHSTNVCQQNVYYLPLFLKGWVIFSLSLGVVFSRGEAKSSNSLILLRFVQPH